MRVIFKQFIKDFKTEVIEAHGKNIKKRIPNILTLSRALAPIFVIPTIMLGKINIAIIELVFFELTDFFDGRLARKYNCVTDFGVKLDAICDKIFALGIIIPAIIKYPVLLINLILEICIGYINFMALLNNKDPKTIIVGKIKTAFLSITLVLAYIPNFLSLYVLMASIVTFMLQIIAFIKYRDIDE